MGSTRKISIVVSGVIFPRTAEESDWYVLDTDRGRISGNMSWRPEPGERLIVEGQWGAYRGQRTFKFKAAMYDVPKAPKAKLSYVCERASGVGYALQTQIWDRWGVDWETAFEEGALPRFKGRVFDHFSETLDAVNTEGMQSETMAWLMDKGATMAMSSAAWNEWEKETIGVVQSNCFRLAELPNFGFKNVDGSIRHQFGIEDGDTRRIAAGVIYALKQLTSNGSTAIPWQQLQVESVKLLGGVYRDMIADVVKDMFEDGSLRGFKASQNIALGTDFFNERDIWQYVTGKVA